MTPPSPTPLGFVLTGGCCEPPAAPQQAPPGFSCPRCAEPPLSVEIMEGPDQLRVNLRGELDMATAPQLGAVTRRLDCRGPNLVVDLSALMFLDIRGARALSELAAKAQVMGRSAVLRGASPRAAFILRHVCTDPEGAVRDHEARLPKPGANTSLTRAWACRPKADPESLPPPPTSSGDARRWC